MARLVADDGRPDLAGQRLGERGGDGVAERQFTGIACHADLGVRSEAIELGYFRRSGDPACGSDARALSRAHDGFDRGAVEPSHLSFLLHLGKEKAADHRREGAHLLDHGDACLLAPPVYHDLAAFGIHGRNDALARQGTAEFRRRGGADHDPHGSGVEPATRAVQVADSATDATRRAAYQLANQLRIESLAERGVEIHNSHFAGDGELFQPLERITAVQNKLLAAPQLYRASTHDVDARYDHRRTRIPRTARSALMPSTVSSPSWKTDAASTASAPAEKAAATCSRVPTPPEAMTGTRTAADTACSSSRSWPVRVPSRSQLVSRISPAPRRSPSRAHATASGRADSRPLSTRTSHRSTARRASIASTTHWQPKACASSVNNSGRRTAAVLTLTLSAPAESN